MKKLSKFLSAFLAVLVISCILIVPSFAANEANAAKPVLPTGEVVVVENEKESTVTVTRGSADEAKFVLYVGKEFAGRHFSLETDAGMAPHAYTVNKDGYIEFRFETGSSSKFELALLDDKKPTVNSETLETVGETSEETTAKSEDNKDENTKEENKLGKKIAVLAFIFGGLIATYIIMCKKSGVPIGKRRRGSKIAGQSFNQDDEF